MVENQFAGPISSIFFTGILLICLMISSAVFQDIFGTNRSSQEIFIVLRKTPRLAVR